MIVLDEPYVSEPLVAWLEESGHPVLDNAPARDLAAQGRASEPGSRRRGGAPPGRRRARVRQFRERPGVDRRPRGQSGPRARHPAVQGQGAHARGAETARSGPVLPDLLGGRAVQARLRTSWKRRSCSSPRWASAAWACTPCTTGTTGSARSPTSPRTRPPGTTSIPKAWWAPGRSCWKAIWRAPSTRWTPTSTRRGPPTCSTSCGTTSPAPPTRATAST